MAPQRNQYLFNIVAGIVTTLATALLVSGYSAKENVTAHQADVQALRAERRAVIDSVNYRISTVEEIALETLCEIKPKSRRCK